MTWPASTRVFRCDHCGAVEVVTRAFCVECGGRDPIEHLVPSVGVCLARTAVTGSDHTTSVLILVQLDDGPVVMGRGCHGLVAGDRVGADETRWWSAVS
ncbi:hypothetical protein [Nocardioides sp. GXZ039]|uniref:hypothetical protein n=1 Tax=Nocardioides sp. GXZ039 TaxID=3136018 RepID=UPI0030F47464